MTQLRTQLTNGRRRCQFIRVILSMCLRDKARTLLPPRRTLKDRDPDIVASPNLNSETTSSPAGMHGYFYPSFLLKWTESANQREHDF